MRTLTFRTSDQTKGVELSGTLEVTEFPHILSPCPQQHPSTSAGVLVSLLWAPNGREMVLMTGCCPAISASSENEIT